MHKSVDKPFGCAHLVKVMHKPISLAGHTGSNRNAQPRRNTGAAIAIGAERSG
jgi:hypothetical protein